ncbi:hypothetical protein An01g13050 [Aspergillus niger]|uniref:Uncharacterized protein n=2 Tax=Aspergillus niger TaxID=5061 RepID=A2QAW8_ASPNC|nr:hypothetical protein An01g13050 [Aspergillus niger]CAK37352.1 hypothetical protein An01g13050 [Aspergillus niger]
MQWSDAMQRKFSAPNEPNFLCDEQTRPTTETNEDSGYNHAPIQAVSAWPSGEGWMPYGPSGYYDAPKLPCISRQSQSNSVSQSGDDNNILPRLLRQHLSLRRKSGIFCGMADR